MLSSMPQAATDALYEARQQRRKQLLKEQMAKKLWEDNYEGDLNHAYFYFGYPCDSSECFRLLFKMICPEVPRNERSSAP